MKNTTKNTTIMIAVSAMYCALLVGGKAALAVLPNVEVVTILIAVCSYVWGFAVALPCVNVFIMIETSIWGINTWVISYLIHWNTVAICFCLIGKLKVKSNLTIVAFSTLCAAVLCTTYGLLTSLVDTLIGFSGGFFVDASNFGYRFAAIYTAGFPFYVTQIVTNVVLFIVGFLPLLKVNQKAKLNLCTTN